MSPHTTCQEFFLTNSPTTKDGVLPHRAPTRMTANFVPAATTRNLECFTTVSRTFIVDGVRNPEYRLIFWNEADQKW